MNDGWARWQADGNWLEDCWFLCEGLQHLDAAGFPLEVRRKAALGLSRVYSPKACVAIRSDPQLGFGPVIAFFVPQLPGIICPLLDLGLDLARIGTFDDPDQLARLRGRQTFRAASYEAGVQASLVAAGFAVERLIGMGLPDFLVSLGPDGWTVEVKALDEAFFDRLAANLRERCASVISPVPGLHLSLECSDDFVEWALGLEEREFADADLVPATQAFGGAAQALLNGRAGPGFYPVPGFGRIVATLADGLGSWTGPTLPDLPDHKRVARCLRPIRKGWNQLPGDVPGVLVLGVFRGANLVQVADAVLQLAAGDADVAQRCRLVVVVDRLPPGGPSGRVVLPVVVSGPQVMSDEERRLMRMLGGRQGEPAIVGRRELAGEQGLKLDTRRPAADEHLRCGVWRAARRREYHRLL